MREGAFPVAASVGRAYRDVLGLEHDALLPPSALAVVAASEIGSAIRIELTEEERSRMVQRAYAAALDRPVELGVSVESQVTGVVRRRAGQMVRLRVETTTWAPQGPRIGTQQIELVSLPTARPRMPSRAAPRPSLADGATVVALHITDDLAARYASVSGDDNPLHLDAEAAARAGFGAPILHGLCLLGLASAAIVKQRNGGHVAAVRATFVAPAFCGREYDIVTIGDEVAPTTAFTVSECSGPAVVCAGSVEVRP